MRRHLVWLMLMPLLAGTVQDSRAVTTRSWSASTDAAFAEGTLDGTAIDQNGHVRLAPEMETLWGPDQGVVWALQAAGDRAAFVALSGPGRVLRVGGSKQTEVWYEPPEESLITALAADGNGGVIFGSSPEGTVVRITRHAENSKVETLVETGAMFVWGLAARADGALWIATGVPGKLLLREPGKKAETVFDAGDDPVRTVANLPGGGAVIGTGGRGRVIRIGADGRAFVLFDAEESEIVSVVADDQGTVYAIATLASKQPGPRSRAAATPPPGASVHVVVGVSPEDGDEEEESAQPQGPRPTPPPSPQSFRTQPGGALYRIDPDGTTRKIWSTAREMPFGVVIGPDGRLIVGTGDSGRVYSIDPEGRAARLLRIASNQVSALATDGSGRVWLGGTNDARVDLVGPGPRAEGSYSTPAIDAESLADWGNVVWDAELPRGAGVELEARSGNTDDPDDTWSPWKRIELPREASRAESDVPAARFFQARFTLERSGEGSPWLRRIEVSYQPRNRPPEITELNVDAPGVVWMRGPNQSSMRLGPVVADDPIARKVAESLTPRGRGGRTARSAGGLRKTYEAGARTYSWSADDPDDDRLRYSLAIRREGTEEWFELVRDLDEEFYSWDARPTPDGMYRVRLVVDDSLDNPNGTHRKAERVSDAFRIDNTRPSVTDFEVKSTSRGREVSFTARDPGGSVAAVEVAVDGHEWMPLSPLDGVADSDVERYTLILEARAAGTAGSRTVVVRVTDSSGNLGGAMWHID